MTYLDLIKEKEKGTVLEHFRTERGTDVEMIQCSSLGITCYMDGLIQSCEMDEKVYHESLVKRVMMHAKEKKKVLILGGGEGAVAREVLESKEVEHVEMYDWDEQIVTMFRDRYSQWGSHAWSDERLHLHYLDVFEHARNQGFPSNEYDVIIIDLFDVSEESLSDYQNLIHSMKKSLKEKGSMVMYVGISDSSPCIKWVKQCETESNQENLCISYQAFIPSFEGDATFMLWFSR